MKIVGKYIELLVYDFDGVMTDNKALLFPSGDEAVFINRSDGLAISRMKNLGVKQTILSSDESNIVIKRGEKLGIPAHNGIVDKSTFLLNMLSGSSTKLENVAFVGNDINDFDIMDIVGLKIAPCDSHPLIIKLADIVTKSNGGNGVIREIYEMISTN